MRNKSLIFLLLLHSLISSAILISVCVRLNREDVFRLRQKLSDSLVAQHACGSPNVIRHVINNKDIMKISEPVFRGCN